jgi:hypothetical protein
MRDGSMKKTPPVLVRKPGGGFVLRHTIEIEVPEGTSLLEAESAMEAALLEAGAGLVEELLHAGDADGQPLVLGGETWTAKAQKEPLVVESTFGAVTIARWAYQSRRGGKCYYPLDRKMELLGSATPKFARSVGFKHAHAPAAKVCQDLEENHGRTISVHFVQALTGLLGEMALSVQPAPDTGLMPAPEEVTTVGVGVDGACLQITVEPDAAEQAQSGAGPDRRKGRRLEWRTAMVGTLAFYNKEGERLGTIYTGCAPPEHSGDGKEDFWFLMERDLAAVKARYPKACYLGLSDGARDFVPWLEQHTQRLVLDFYHATGYLGGAAAAMTAGGEGHKKRTAQWLTEACHDLKHQDGAAARLCAEMKLRLANTALSAGSAELLQKAVTYFSNNLDRMDYAARMREHQPIGSGVTEAACGLIIKDRMCGRGMRWSLRMAQHIITLRSLISTTARCWQTFWKANFSKAIT